MKKNSYLHISVYIDERKLGIDEKPLLVQLNWHKDDREGRFLLRRIDEKTNVFIYIFISIIHLYFMSIYLLLINIKMKYIFNELLMFFEDACRDISRSWI